MTRLLVSFFAVAVSVQCLAATVQIDVSATFDADVVLNDGMGLDTTQDPVDWLTPLTVGPASFCYATQSAATAINPANPNGLPDDGFFPAGAFNPDVQLQVCNFDDGLNARRLTANGQFALFSVPQDSYTELHLFVTTGSGNGLVTVTLTYTDLTTDVLAGVFTPDWFDDPVDTATQYHLVDGLDRFRCDGISGFENSNDPAIFGLRVDPDPMKILDTVRIERTFGSGPDTIVNFFGATGEAVGSPGSSLVSASITASSMTVVGGSPVSPGGTFDVDVGVDSTFPMAQMVRVDFVGGPGMPPPTLPLMSPITMTIMVPAMGSAMASFVGVPAPASAEVWRGYAVANADLALPECNLTDNIVSTEICFADMGCAATCGDCDESGSLPASILDSLVSAQIAAGLLMPSMNQLCVCDVNATGAIEILDALLIAQNAAGLPVSLSCGAGGGTSDVALALLPPAGVDPVSLEIDVCGPMAVDLTFEYTTDAGVTFNVATAHGSSPLPSPSPGTTTGTVTFAWASGTDLPLPARPAAAELRVTAYDPIGMTMATATSATVNLLAGVCMGTVEGDLSGMPLPIVVMGNSSGADDTALPTCNAGGSDHIYGFAAPMTASYTVTLCGSTFDTVLEVREMDCQTGLSVGCNDDVCGLQSELSGLLLTAGTYYYIDIEGWNGGAGGAYTLTITSP